jgi:WD40 repeat protein
MYVPFSRFMYPTLTLPNSHSVRSVAFAPNGTRIVLGFDDKTAQLWDALSVGAPMGKPL